ncbi:DUF4097 family beta strand repeat protein [Viridibacillus sp. YIM B01967]|uniref:DUF4097 family beta strand repeat protein n=1 Tax=Viridibacillus soli TaxID=2798301 RepID=A0ABS1H621_9BACL|nr:DUF4097 family beta strand repeat-containing protein [Viridibacillus soli]MBK3494863.1 DUF4097 family beta strand repeat protein [Viridibacillus soli]
MQSERKRILTLLEKGTITAQEAILLLEALEKKADVNRSDEAGHTAFSQTEEKQQEEQPQPESEQKQPNSNDYFGRKEEPKKQCTRQKSTSEQEFFDEIKQDFSQFSTKFMDFMNTAVSKVKDLDFDFGIGEKNAFEHHFDIENAEFTHISVDIPNGLLQVKPSTDATVRAECRVRPTLVRPSDNLEKEFLDKFIITNDNGKLRIISNLKSVRVDIVLFVPKRQYEVITASLFNGSFALTNLDVSKLKVKTMNGSIDCRGFTFKSVDLESANGAIKVKDVAGEELEAETVNGQVYIDGAIREIEARSVNGHVVVTTRAIDATRVKAQTVAGAVEFYIPSTLSLQGEVSSNLGKMDVQLADVQYRNEQEQFLQKSVRFSKKIPDAQTLTIDGETRTGSVVVRYNP